MWAMIKSTAKASFFAGALASGLGLAAASAADFPVKARPLAGPHNWSGCHIGGNAGWIKDSTNLALRPAGAFQPFLGQQAIDFFTQRYEFDNSGLTIGGQLGCDRQWGNLVLGVEADLNWSSLESTISTTYDLLTAPGGQTFAPHTEQLSNELRWYSTLRGRAGFAMDQVLIYATGGLAIGGMTTTSHLFNTVGFTLGRGSEDQTRFGWTVGGGIEYAFASNWSVRAEYLYLDFGRFSFDSLTSPPTAFLFTNDVRSHFHVARVGLSYRFGGPER
jgi:outer membrane immunogenic protein